MGAAMSMSLGREAAKSAVVELGMERASLHVIGTGCALGLALGIGFFLAPRLRIPLVPYLAYAVGVSLLAAKWHFGVYEIQGAYWIVAGLIVPMLALAVSAGMIERDRRERRIVMEQARSHARPHQ